MPLSTKNNSCVNLSYTICKSDAAPCALDAAAATAAKSSIAVPNDDYGTALKNRHPSMNYRIATD